MKKSNKAPITSNNELISFLGRKNPERLSYRLSAFIHQQCATWPTLRQAREALKRSLIRKIFLSDLEVYVQNMPHRLKSSSSRVDKKSVEERPCFLCSENLYPNQKGLPYKKKWLILNNPSPIFLDHLVVSHQDHHPQLVSRTLRTMISFVENMDFSFSVFYNGPACGASAPDHLHFQACPEGSMPITRQLTHLIFNPKNGLFLKPIEKSKTGTSFIGSVDNRGFFLCMTPDSNFLYNRLTSVITFLKNKFNDPQEPLMNLIISGIGPKYLGILLPRKVHRPACYYNEGKERILVSPGAVDVAGLVILPRKRDYERITRENLLKIFYEVCHEGDIFKNLML